MANSILWKYGSTVSMTMTLASLANGSARQSDFIDASTLGYPEGCLVAMKITSGGTGPTAGRTYQIFLLRADDVKASDTMKDDAAGDSDAAITIENAPLLGAIQVTNTTNKAFYGVFDTKALGPIGPSLGIAVKNDSGQALHGTEGNHLKRLIPYYPEVQ